MRTLTAHETRTIRMGAALLLGYLLLFYGVRGWKALEARRTSYQKLVQEARKVKDEFALYEAKAQRIDELKEKYHIDLAKLPKETLVADASAAIQRAAMSGGVQIGPIRESAARPSAKELSSIQLEAMGQVPQLTAFLHSLQTLGFPLIIDSMQLGSEPNRPGPLKLSLTIIILDYEQFKAEEVRRA